MDEEQQYTDFSCRTPMERLARDIEIILRDWHLHLNDRHVSSDIHQDNSKSLKQGTSLVRKRSTIKLRQSSKSDVDTMQDVILIRRKEILFQGHVVTLCLWDAPPSLVGIGNDISSHIYPNNDNHTSLDIPLSLKSISTKLDKSIPHDFVRNLSTLFGIGQHLTLDFNRNHCRINYVSLLQGALNLALDSCKCRIPGFALVGYPNSPTWMSDNCCVSNSVGFTGLFGYCNPGYNANSIICSFAAEISRSNIPVHCQSIKGLSVLFSCQSNVRSKSITHTRDFMLSFARHTYLWQNYNKTKQDWYYIRAKSMDRALNMKGRGSSENRRTKVIIHALRLLEGSTENLESDYWKRELSFPLWGSYADPLHSVRLMVQWNEEETATFISMRNLDDNDDVALNPIHSAYGAFRVKVEWDDSVSCITLGLSLRCILAAYIKSCTVDRGLLLSHILSTKVRKGLIATNKPINQKIIESLDSATRSLVEAMDWDEDLPNFDVLNDIIEEVFSDFAPFPLETKAHPNICSSNADDWHSQPSLPFKHSAPIGRLFSIMCMRLGKMRTPVGMAALWLGFTDFIRIKYDIFEKLPNLDHVDILDGKSSSEQHFLGKYCENSRLIFTRCIEPTPDISSCLIHQKMQAFNVCMETMAITERSKMNANSYPDCETSVLDTVPETEPFNESQASHPIIHNIEDEYPGCEYSIVSSPASFDDDDDISKTELPSLSRCETEFFDLDNDLQTDESKLMKLSPSDKRETEYFDLTEAHNVKLANGDNHFDPDATEETLPMKTGTFSTKTPKRHQRFTRVGARCPVQDMSLKTNGNQMYSPYLQRACPSTIDFIHQKHSLLSKLSCVERLEYIHKYQRPQLLSDMQSFKAANQGAVFQDFVSWYPTESFDQHCLLDPSNSNTAFAVLDAASDAAHILTATRKLWFETWESAKACPADAQPSLFDATSEAEKILHYFETMHPSELLNQVFTVSLTNANFILRSAAGPSMEIPCVKRAFERLDKLTNKAVVELNDILLVDDESDLNKPHRLLLSPDIIAMCEDVCDCVAAIESLLSHVSSLEQNFPGIQDIIDTILMNLKEEAIAVESNEARTAFLRTLEKRQMDVLCRGRKSDEHDFGFPLEASQREYIFRTLRGKNPCRLYVNIDEGSTDKRVKNRPDRSVLLAFLKSSTE